jgi:hypothetical protein
MATKPLIELGGFLHFNSGYKGFSAHAELEKAFKRRPYFTSGPRLDYTDYKDVSQDKDFYVGYQLKFYPLYWNFNAPYQGIAIGVEPMWLGKSNDSDARYGPGIGTSLGYQHLFGKRIYMSLDTSMFYIQNINDQAPPKNPEDRYFYFFLSLNLGLRFK